MILALLITTQELTGEEAFNQAQQKLKEISVAPSGPKKVQNVFDNLLGDDSDEDD